MWCVCPKKKLKKVVVGDGGGGGYHIILYRSTAACEKSFKGYVKIIVLCPEYLLRLPQRFLRGMEIEDDMVFVFFFNSNYTK